METVLNAFSACLVLLLLMSVGYFMGHKGWMTPAEKTFLSKFIMMIAVPCLCIRGLVSNLDRAGLIEAAPMMLSVLLGILVNFLLAALLMPLLKLPRKQRGVFLAMCTLSNTLFIGLPVCQQLFGDVCVPYVMVYYLVNTSLLQTLGVTIIAHYGESGGKTTVGGFLKSFFSKPPVIAVFVAVAMILLDVKLPVTLDRFMSYLSNSVSPIALIYCGYVVYEIGLKDLRLMRGLPTMLVIRLAVAPVICLFFSHLFGVEGLARSVFAVEAALPVVSQTPVMAGAYGADDRYAAIGATLSTIGCIVTIPLLMVVLG